MLLLVNKLCVCVLCVHPKKEKIFALHSAPLFKSVLKSSYYKSCGFLMSFLDTKASSTRIRKFVKTQIVFYEYGLRPHVSQRIFRPYPEIFENALQSGNFFIRYEYVYVWTVVSGNLRIRFRHSLISSLHGEHYKQTWRRARFYLLC